MALNPNLLNIVMIWCLALFFPVINAVKNMCVAGAVQDVTSQFSHYTEGTSDRRYNRAETLVSCHTLWEIFISRCMSGSGQMREET
ncbi:endonuclease 1 [Pyrus ussuriensis x Pyrus communis]|uniref:Endonuclease 1 n=1 Tax=Pyrus ussuriensis x Pyrus communis TaxID=2448454 RepID=A0A5N5H813_9ROSA|nr:endonuclease 1 [Pyrus ussuriensis x Pyrus communis]